MSRCIPTENLFFLCTHTHTYTQQCLARLYISVMRYELAESESRATLPGVTRDCGIPNFRKRRNPCKSEKKLDADESASPQVLRRIKTPPACSLFRDRDHATTASSVGVSSRVRAHAKWVRRKRNRKMGEREREKGNGGKRKKAGREKVRVVPCGAARS